jgi:hypothetical protein
MKNYQLNVNIKGRNRAELIKILRDIILQLEENVTDEQFNKIKPGEPANFETTPYSIPGLSETIPIQGNVRKAGDVN